MKIIGIGGRDRSGKDSLAEMFIDAGFYGYSFGDAVRAHARTRHADKPDPISVKNLTETSNWLRSKFGPDIILKQALEEFEEASKSNPDYKGIVMFSIRAPIEADFIVEQGGELIWVETTDEIRHKRRIDNIRDGEKAVSLEEMLEHESLQENPQEGTPKEVQMNLGYVKSKATIIFENNGDNFKEFKKSAQKIVEQQS